MPPWLPPDYALLIAGAVLAGFVQGLSGFAFAMVSMSVWVWGLEPRVASVMAVFGGLTGQVFAAVQMRRPLRLVVLYPFLLGGALGVPVGVALLPHLDAVLFKAVLGTLLVVCCPLMMMAQRLPRLDHGGRLADALAGAAGGVMGGFGGFTGVVPALWCTLRNFDKDLQRTVIQNFNLAALAATMAAYLATGAVTAPMLPMFAVVAPALLIPSLLGTRLYIGLSELSFRRVVLVLLTASGVAMIAASWPTLWYR
ncbi:MAG: sulfite exporter TauE/SafE family protein [Burkholderiales bacterium]|nr:sulfite exporter TauE/SafE family protein [Burkholderiales bacterium]